MADALVTSFANETQFTHLSLIGADGIAPTLVKSVEFTGTKMIIDNNKQPCKIIKCKRMGPAKSGNSHTANWRKVHGGGWCMPLNTKFKSKNSRGSGATAASAAKKAA